MSKKEDKSITNALKVLEKRYGAPCAQKMSNKSNNIKTISTGRPLLDSEMGGGWAVGKIHEIFAESGAGKTGLALEAVAEVQKLGGVVAYIDMEHALNTEYCDQVGVDINDMYISQPDYGEQAFEIIRSFINTNKINLIIVDSVAALVPLSELEGEVGETKIAMQARMMSKGLKLITPSAAANECTVIFINQLREKVTLYGDPKITPGGKSLKFYSTTRCELKNKGKIKNGTASDSEVIGFKQEIHIVKNKIAAPFRVVKNDIIYGKGIDSLGDIMDALVFEEIITKNGAIYYYNDIKIARGIKEYRKCLEDNPELLQELEDKLKELKNK